MNKITKKTQMKTKKLKISSFHLQNKKAQMKIQQMAFMLMAITLFFVLAGMFALMISMAGLKESATALEEKNALLLVTKLANSPEFSCGNSYGRNRINCVDSDKIMMLRENILKYQDFWGVTNIEVKKIYPIDTTNVLCNTGNYPYCDVIRLISQNITGQYISNYISLCRKELKNGEIYDQCDLAEIMVSYEEVK